VNANGILGVVAGIDRTSGVPARATWPPVMDVSTIHAGLVSLERGIRGNKGRSFVCIPG
jgi:hypothetical protein